MVKEIAPRSAWQLLQDDPKAVLIDVRSSMEYLFVGHPQGAVHVAWIDEPDWEVDPAFATHVRQLVLGGSERCNLASCSPILLICRSGYRSREAGQLLVGEGFRDVYNISDGFEGPPNEQHQRSTLAGWRFHGLPWEQC